MVDLNKCIFTGRIGTDVELKTAPSGVMTCSFRLAVERPKAKGAQDAETEWLDIVAWRNTAEFCARYLTKGRKVVVECAARTRRWTDRENRTHKAIEFHASNIIPCDSKATQSTANVPTLAPQADYSETMPLGDDESLPF